jgi:hypothetical protein
MQVGADQMACPRDEREKPEIDDDRREPAVEEAFDRLISEGSNRLARPLVPLLATGFVGGIDVGVGMVAVLRWQRLRARRLSCPIRL